MELEAAWLPWNREKVTVGTSATVSARWRHTKTCGLSRHHTETNEQAKARWQAENPGKDLERAGLVVILTEWAE